jgi:hypothetical protein
MQQEAHHLVSVVGPAQDGEHEAGRFFFMVRAL